MTAGASFLAAQVAPGTLLGMWLGQAGFAFKTPEGTIVMVDPYLSDAAEASAGLARISPAPIESGTLMPDVLLITHAHVDHLDPPTVQALGQSSATVLVGPAEVVRRATAELGWRGETRMVRRADTLTLAGIDLVATLAFHGELGSGDSDDAVGFELHVAGLCVWHAGDSEYDARLHRSRRDRVDVALLPINGSGGNMDAREAALLAHQLRAGAVLPMHFGMWSDDGYRYGGQEPHATPDPRIFVDTYDALRPEGNAVVPVVGEPFVIRRRSAAHIDVTPLAKRPLQPTGEPT